MEALQFVQFLEVDSLTVTLLVLIATVVAYYKFTQTEPDVHPLVLAQQASLPPIRNQGESSIHRANAVPHGSPLLRAPTGSIKTLYDIWTHTTAGNANETCMTFLLQNQGVYLTQSYAVVDRRIRNFGTGLLKLTELEPKTEAMVGIFSASSQETFVAQQALIRYSLVAVPVHDLRNKEALIEIVNQTKLSVVISSNKTLQLLLDTLDECSYIKTIVVAGIYISQDQINQAQKHGVTLVKFATVEYDGSWTPREASVPSPEDVVMINFNTKSTSQSKGVMLTHANVVASTTALLASLPGGKKLSKKDRLLSHFSNSDVLGTVLTTSLVSVGGSIVFPTGLMKNVLHDAQLSEPTVFASMPIILEKIQEALTLSYGHGTFFQKAYASKLAQLKQGHITSSSAWDYIGLSEPRGKMGGKVRLVITTDVAKPETLEYFRVVTGAHVVATYGRTETTGLSTIRNLYDYTRLAHSGPPVGCNEIKLVDDKDLGLSATDEPNPRGEIYVRGPNVMKGYYKKPNATSSVIDDQGWFRTWDLGEFHTNGVMEVIGRKKKKTTKS